ncbi:MAG: class I SAM-dependent methyltransferase [Anaerolineae bacterium]
MNPLDRALKEVQSFFTEKLTTYGADPKGVDWKDAHAQRVRFDQLLKIVRTPTEPFSLLDYGCGYGALAGYLAELGLNVRYIGYDFTPAAVEAARAAYGHLNNGMFVDTTETLAPVDYVVSSGVFNMKLQAPTDAWEIYVKQIIEEQWALALKGISFNCLTSYSDPEYMRDDLYYADPKAYFDWCKRTLSRNVALLHDYNTYDWTMLVRKG